MAAQDAGERRDKRKANGQGRVFSWRPAGEEQLPELDAVDPKAIGSVVQAVVLAGGYVAFSRTSDGGAVKITAKLDDVTQSEFLHTTREIEHFLTALYEYYT